MKTSAEHRYRSNNKRLILDTMILFLLGLSIFFPSSVNSDLGMLTVERFVFFIVVLLFLGIRFFKISQWSLIGFSAIISLYLFFTIISEYSQFAFGHILSMSPILILAVLRVKRAPSIVPILYLYYFTACFVFSLAYFGFVFPAVSDFMVGFYSGGYAGLAERFQAKFIPVSIFVSHSYAGFFYFVFVFVSVYLMSCGFSKIMNSLVIVFSLISMLLLMSGSSYFFFIYSCVFLSCSVLFMTSKSYAFVFFRGFFAILFFPTVCYFGIYFIPSFIERILGDSGNGLLSRYGSGVLAENLDYLSKSPLVGIGFGYSDRFYYTDSDYIVTALRLGVLGSFIYFSYIFLFLYYSIKSLIGSFYFLFFMGAVSAFMVSMPVSTFYRTTPILILLMLLFKAANNTVFIDN